MSHAIDFAYFKAYFSSTEPPVVIFAWDILAYYSTKHVRWEGWVNGFPNIQAIHVQHTTLLFCVELDTLCA